MHLACGLVDKPCSLDLATLLVHEFHEHTLHLIVYRVVTSLDFCLCLQELERLVEFPSNVAVTGLLGHDHTNVAQISFALRCSSTSHSASHEQAR